MLTDRELFARRREIGLQAMALVDPSDEMETPARDVISDVLTAVCGDPRNPDALRAARRILDMSLDSYEGDVEDYDWETTRGERNDMSALTLERKHEQDDLPLQAPGGGNIMITPPIDEDYWAYRVKLSETQAIVGFPKFGTVGVGFAIEDDWNTNLPYTCETEEIFGHIVKNKGDESISDDDVREAIRLVQEAARVDRD